MFWKLSIMPTKRSKYFLKHQEKLLKFIFLIPLYCRIQIVKDHCMHFLIKEENFTDVVMSNEFSDLDKPLLVEIIRKKLNPSKIVQDPNTDKNVGKLKTSS